MPPLPIDCVIFGGGVAGMWILDALARSGRSVLLLEGDELGAGQTVCAQGIIHGGFKYTLRGLLTASARSVAEMPGRWRSSLEGGVDPRLTSTRVRAESCFLWQTRSLASAVGMLGARAGLRVAPEFVEPSARPRALRDTPGTVARIHEQVIDPMSLLDELSQRWRSRILRIDVRSGLELRVPARTSSPHVECVSLIRPETGDLLDLAPDAVVFAAGVGNESLRSACGLDAGAAQRRPLHMALVRGELPELNGHCVDGAKTRATITSALDSERRMVWQVGGQLAEEGVVLDDSALSTRAAAELAAVLPGVDLTAAEWATYRVDRAERRLGGTQILRPDDAQLLRDGNVLTAWPTKLALAPRLADMVLAAAPPPQHPFDLAKVSGWPRPQVALPPWETSRSWRRL